jgi:acetoin utilization protein AcuC
MLIIHSSAYAGWIFDPDHPTQGRRFTNGYNELTTLHPDATVLAPAMSDKTRPRIEAVHDLAYVARVLDDHECAEWRGKRPDMAHLAELFVAGTIKAVLFARENADKDAIYVHLPGAKHHAQYATSSGFCVFNDWAVAINALLPDKRVAILDIDAHHGDGVENLLRDNPNVLTVSIHDGTIFPGTGHESNIESGVVNYPLARGAGDDEFREAVKDALVEMREFEPDLVFITAGADGHVDDPLSTLQYTLEGYRQVAHAVAVSFPETPIVIGGAGGYNPDTFTPRVWAEFVDALVTKRRRAKLGDLPSEW